MSPFKKSFLILSVGFIVSLFIFPQPIFAAQSIVETVFGFDTSSPVGWVNSIYRYGVMAISLFAAAGIVYGGIRYLTSAGNPEAITSAKNAIFSAISGLVLMLLSHMILRTLDPRLVKLQLTTGPTIALEEYSLLGLAEMNARGGYPPGAGCEMDSGCVFGYACMPSTDDPNSPKTCQKVKTEGSAIGCNSIDDCDASKGERCYKGVCSVETRCLTHRDCGEGYLCVLDIQKCWKKELGEKAEGALCVHDNECQSGFCNQGKRKCEKEFGAGEGELCQYDSDCDGRYCVDGKCAGSIRERPNGAACTAHAQCQSGICGGEGETGECKTPQDDGQPCFLNEECKSGYCSHVNEWGRGGRDPYICTDPTRRGEEGDQCEWNSDCSSNICLTFYRPNQCAPVGGQKDGEECEYSVQCASHCCVDDSGKLNAIWNGIEWVTGRGSNRTCRAASYCQ